MKKEVSKTFALLTSPNYPMKKTPADASQR
jgi:hypothetical protein